MPPALADELRRARQAMLAADKAYGEVILRALRAGASLGEIAFELGMSKTAINQKAKGLGWPDAAEQARRAAEVAAREWMHAHHRSTDSRPR